MVKIMLDASTLPFVVSFPSEAGLVYDQGQQNMQP